MEPPNSARILSQRAVDVCQAAHDARYGDISKILPEYRQHPSVAPCILERQNCQADQAPPGTHVWFHGRNPLAKYAELRLKYPDAYLKPTGGPTWVLYAREDVVLVYVSRKRPTLLAELMTWCGPGSFKVGAMRVRPSKIIVVSRHPPDGFATEDPALLPKVLALFDSVGPFNLDLGPVSGAKRRLGVEVEVEADSDDDSSLHSDSD